MMQEIQDLEIMMELNEIELERATYLINLDELVFERHSGF